ncbi:phage tail protein [Azospirillum sp. CT11-132]|uniref:phage tail protein n=1 Tax=Azospirillum sp. CT11-132 TaxID=3396317 RepID=UPI0039A46A6C
MVDAYTGEIRMFAGNYAPPGWHFANGALLRINDYQALYSLYGVTWGGDGATTFGLPNLCGRLPIGQGQSPTAGSTNRILGQYVGTESVTLQEANLPTHTHTFNVSSTIANTQQISNSVVLGSTSNGYLGYVTPTAGKTTTVTLPANTVNNTTDYAANPSPHENRMSGIAINYIVCLNGLYPMRA